MLLLIVAIISGWWSCRSGDDKLPVFSSICLTALMSFMLMMCGTFACVLLSTEPNGYAISKHTVQGYIYDNDEYAIKWDDEIHVYDRDIVKETDSLSPHTIEIREDNKIPADWTFWILSPLSKCGHVTEISEVNINP